MVKSGIAVITVGLLVLFGYFYAANRTGVSRTEKAKQAATDVGDTVRDKGVAGLVDMRLKTKLGFDATRFLHAYYDEGHVVLYGLVPADVDQQLLIDEAGKVPGVDSVELLAQPRPAHIAPLKPVTGRAPEPRPEPTP